MQQRHNKNDMRTHSERKKYKEKNNKDKRKKDTINIKQIKVLAFSIGSGSYQLN
jgi:hypothetical protein